MMALRALGIVVGLAFLVVIASMQGLPVSAQTPTSTATPAATPDLASILRQHLDAVNRGDVDAAVAAFTDDATLVRGTCSPLNPCVGKAEVQRQVQNEANNRV